MTLQLYGLRWRDRGHYLTRAAIPSALLHSLRLIALTPPERSLYLCPPFDPARLQHVSPRNERSMLNVLTTLVQNRLYGLGDYDTPEGARAADAKDARTLQRPNLRVEERLALTYVKGQRPHHAQRPRHHRPHEDRR